jgi:hypothetical protein
MIKMEKLTTKAQRHQTDGFNQEIKKSGIEEAESEGLSVKWPGTARGMRWNSGGLCMSGVMVKR